MQNVFVISHASDIDGVGSAALVKRKYKIPASRLFFTDYSREGIEYIIKELKKPDLRNSVLILADLGVNAEVESGFESVVRMFKGKDGHVYWFDHHPWSNSSIKRIATKCDVAIIGENEKYCGTEITHRELGFKDSFTKKFAELVHYSDFNLRPKDKNTYKTIGYYAMSITYYNISDSKKAMHRNLRHIAHVISRGRFLDKKIIGDAEKFRKLNDSRIKSMAKDLYIGEHVALGFSKEIQSTAACAAIHDNSDRDIAVYVNFRTGRGHIRSKKQDISELARALGGGGHPHASGFSINPKLYNNFKSKKDKEKLLKKIEKVLGLH